MSNYYGITRTNYFKVTDVDKFTDILNRCVADNCEGISIFERLAEDNTKFYGFGCYGDLEGFKDENDDYNFDAFAEALREVIPEGEAIIITHVGHEKLRYVGGNVTIITKDKVAYDYLSSIALKMAREQLGNPEWTTTDNH